MFDFSAPNLHISEACASKHPTTTALDELSSQNARGAPCCRPVPTSGR
jgi:hypothetical protein